MVHEKTILKALPHVLKSIDLQGLGKKQSGKVRDFYVFGDKRIIVTTDRQSAFDVMLGYIPFKGTVLNLLCDFWFHKTSQIIPNHLISIPDPNVSIVFDCQPVPVEIIVRGYLSGVTGTSIWPSYQRGERLIYGIKFPEGMRKNQKLPRPIITPTTHGGGKSGHDDRLTREKILRQKVIDKKIYLKMEEVSFELFKYGSQLCQKQGLILVDTKYEFGLYNGKLILIDEIHTPDSSRFWIADTYRGRFEKGMEPDNFDKEFLRLWYANRGYRGDGPPPKMSKQLIIDLSKRYIAVWEKLTGQKFKAYNYPIEERIKRNVQRYVQ